LSSIGFLNKSRSGRYHYSEVQHHESRTVRDIAETTKDKSPGSRVFGGHRYRATSPNSTTTLFRSRSVPSAPLWRITGVKTKGIVVILHREDRFCEQNKLIKNTGKDTTYDVYGQPPMNAKENRNRIDKKNPKRLTSQRPL
jgi:hypothetical protein